MIALSILAFVLTGGACVADFTAASPAEATAREYAIGIALVLTLAGTYTVFRNRDDDRRGERLPAGGRDAPQGVDGDPQGQVGP